MEYEIGDDPQGLPDRPEGDRGGGIRENLFFRRESRFERRTPSGRDAPVEQLGELA